MRDPKIIFAASMAATFYNGKDGFANHGRVNEYHCVGRRKCPSVFTPGSGFAREPGCGHVMITADREPGVTPFITSCPKCGGDTQSKLYRVQQKQQPSHEWFRPDTLAGLPQHTVDHILKGGLILRAVAADAVKAE